MFGFQNAEKAFLFRNFVVYAAKLACNLIRRKEEALKLFVEDGLQVNDRDLVPACLANVFVWHIRRHVHLMAASAMGDPRK
jgi:hypothetical protein